METPESIRAFLITGEWVSSIELSDATLQIPIHPVSRKYLQFSSVPVHLPPFQPSHGHTNFHNNCKGGEADGPHKGSRTALIPRRLAHQDPVSGGGTREHSDRGGSNTDLRVHNQSREV